MVYCTFHVAPGAGDYVDIPGISHVYYRICSKGAYTQRRVGMDVFGIGGNNVMCVLISVLDTQSLLLTFPDLRDEQLALCHPGSSLYRKESS